MNQPDSLREALDASVDAIEGGYEFLLAYAAQGRHTDRGGNADSGLRTHLANMSEALGALPGQVHACVEAKSANLLEDSAEFFAAIEADAGIARGAIRLVLSQSDISSQLIDNLNASIHLRAILTDIFLIDEALKHKRV